MSATITVGTNSYISLADAKTYVGAALHSDAWDAASDDHRIRALLTAARMIERITWISAKTSALQALSFPRTSLTDKYGTALSSSAVPTDIINAQTELAMALLQNIDVQTSSTAQKNKKVKAGSVEVEFFKTPKGQATQLPKIVNDLVLPYLASSAATSVIIANGTDNESQFDCDDEYKLDGGGY